MDELFEKKFFFLEIDSHFYDMNYKEFEGDNGLTQYMVYTFYLQRTPYEVYSQIYIPVDAPSKNVKWKFCQFNMTCEKASYQGVNTNIEVLPDWFGVLLSKAKLEYERLNRVRRVLVGA